jgi:structure-specific endonuclease subunit SLX1
MAEGMVSATSSGSKKTSAPPLPETETEAPEKGIHALDVTHNPFKPALAKSTALLTSKRIRHCTLCTLLLPASGASTVLCPSQTCTAITHLTCLATHFLASETKTSTSTTTGNTDTATPSILPTSGPCPSCSTTLQWHTLVSELSLRMRGEKEVKALFKVPRARKRKGDIIAGEEEEEEEAVGGVEEQEESELEMMLDEDGWARVSESEDRSEIGEVVETVGRGRGKGTTGLKSVGKAMGGKGKARAKRKGPEVVVEDSDGESDEIFG